jgi:hypothetical protein
MLYNQEKPGQEIPHKREEEIPFRKRDDIRTNWDDDMIELPSQIEHINLPKKKWEIPPIGHSKSCCKTYVEIR